jgi:hypothetical protein
LIRTSAKVSKYPIPAKYTDNEFKRLSQREVKKRVLEAGRV